MNEHKEKKLISIKKRLFSKGTSEKSSINPRDLLQKIKDEEMIEKQKDQTIHSSIWDDVFDYKKGTTLRLVCNNAIYTGYLKYIEEKGKDSWIALSDYIIEENGTESKIPKDLSDSLIVVPMSTILRIETFY